MCRKTEAYAKEGGGKDRAAHGPAVLAAIADPVARAYRIGHLW